MRPGQIIANSHDRFPPNGWFSKGNRLISGKSRLVKQKFGHIYIYNIYIFIYININININIYIYI